MINIFPFILIFILKLRIFVWSVVGCVSWNSLQIIQTALSVEKVKYPVLVLHALIVFVNTSWIFSVKDRGLKEYSYTQKNKIPLFHKRKFNVNNKRILHSRVMVRNNREVAQWLVHWHAVMSTNTVPHITDCWNQGETPLISEVRGRHCH
jgi:hypothetical protein